MSGFASRISCVALLVAALMPAIAYSQTYVTPMMGGGQVSNAPMIHIDLSYDSDANRFDATLDTSYGAPELIALPAGTAFDSSSLWAMLDGKAYNYQYGWNVGGFFTMPPGAAIWIELVDATPGLEVYDGRGTRGTYAPIFGTAGSPRTWKWSGVMVHNTYAISNALTARLFAEYHIYFGDANTGSRDGFTQFDGATVRLEWRATVVDDPLTFRFGALSLTNAAPLAFLNASNFVASSEFVLNLRPTTNGSAVGFERMLPMLVVPATATNGGPATNHAAAGSCVELEAVSLAGPTGARLSWQKPDATPPLFAISTGETRGTNRVRLSASSGAPGCDPFGRTQWRLSVDQPGLYRLGFRTIDRSTNGPARGPLHSPSSLYAIYLQAGVSLAPVEKQAGSVSVLFGSEAGRSFSLERSLNLGPSAAWITVAGPVIGTNRLQRLMDATAPGKAFYRLRAE